ncbi:hypothetical protein [Nonomuraea sp. NPDC050643]|uniref:hypothetical protein n=1 Tax=Nonomuraea sp. NPDC050643 TaxID=3155660 RepID=UPI0033F05E06
MDPAPKRSRKRWARIFAVLVALLVAAIAGVAWAYPSVAATTCPACYGLTELQDGVYTEDNLSDQQESQVKQIVEQARQLLESFYGSRTSSPILLICLTDSCYNRIGGGKERGVAVLNRAVMLSPRGINAVIASHEMSHVELHTRLTSDLEIPQWFDEGLAVVASNDPRYLAPESSADRCLVPPTAPLPVTLEQWLSAASKDANTYAKAACQVSRWLHDNQGRTGLMSLIDRLNAGAPFTSIVPLT